mgnify:CR=1 FL=1
MNNFHAVGRIAAEIKLQKLDMNMRTRGTFSKCFM